MESISQRNYIVWWIMVSTLMSSPVILSASDFALAKPVVRCTLGEICSVKDWRVLGFIYFRMESDAGVRDKGYHVITSKIVNKIDRHGNRGKISMSIVVDGSIKSLFKLHLKSGINIRGIYLLESDGEYLYYRFQADIIRTIYFKVPVNDVAYIELPRGVLMPPAVFSELLDSFDDSSRKK